MAQTQITVLENQSIIDIAVKYYGTAEAVGEILSLNPDIINSPTALEEQGIDANANLYFQLDIALKPGELLTIDSDSYLINQTIVTELSNKSITTYE